MLQSLSACGSSKPSSEETTAAPAESTTAASVEESADPFGKYDSGITITRWASTMSTRKYPSGDTWENNLWTRAYEEKLGIKFEYIWVVDQSQFDEKVNVAIASDDLPEMVEVPYNKYYRLAQAGKLQDLSSAYEKYASPMLKEYFSKFDSFAPKNLSLDGKLYGFANPDDLTGPTIFLYTRDDWMKKLNLPAPKSVEDVLNIARAIVNQDPDGNGKKDTFGIALHKDLWSGGMPIDGLINALGAQQRIWVEKNGKLEYSSIQPEMKEALRTLQGYYKEGLIDKEFGTKQTWVESYNDLVAGKYGIAYGYNWFPLWAPQDIIKKNPEVTWTAYPIPAQTPGQTAPVQLSLSLNGKTVVCATPKLKNPEAVVKLMNLSTALMYDPNMAEQKYHDFEGVETFFYAPLIIGPANWNITCSDKVIEAMDAGDASKLNPEQKGYYDRSVAYKDKGDLGAYGTYKVFAKDGTMQMMKPVEEQKLYIANKYTGPETETMTTKQTNLNNKEIELFTRIIMGADVDAEFDKWVTYYNAQGGAEITKEVNDWWARQPK